MDDVRLSVHEFQAAEQAKRQAEAWLLSFEAALRSADASQTGLQGIVGGFSRVRRRWTES